MKRRGLHQTKRHVMIHQLEIFDSADNYYDFNYSNKFNGNNDNNNDDNDNDNHYYYHYYYY